MNTLYSNKILASIAIVNTTGTSMEPAYVKKRNDSKLEHWTAKQIRKSNFGGEKERDQLKRFCSLFY